MDAIDLTDEAIDRWLRERTTPGPPPGFSAAVMSRIRQERWRAEHYWDVGFNIAVAAGLLLIMTGVVGLIYTSGLVVVGHDAVLLFVEAITAVANQLLPVLPAYAAALAFIATALGLWWYVENY